MVFPALESFQDNLPDSSPGVLRENSPEQQDNFREHRANFLHMRPKDFRDSRELFLRKDLGLPREDSILLKADSSSRVLSRQKAQSSSRYSNK